MHGHQGLLRESEIAEKWGGIGMLMMRKGGTPLCR